jgi:hypothetical protein
MRQYRLTWRSRFDVPVDAGERDLASSSGLIVQLIQLSAQSLDSLAEDFDLGEVCFDLMKFFQFLEYNLQVETNSIEAQGSLARAAYFLFYFTYYRHRSLRLLFFLALEDLSIPYLAERQKSHDPKTAQKSLRIE